MESLSNRFLQEERKVEQNYLQHGQEISFDALRRNARQLFRMFDREKSGSISFEVYKQMLAFMKVDLLESKAYRYFKLVDEQNKGLIDEREFTIAMYVTYIRNLLKKQTHEGTEHVHTLSPIDVFNQFDSDHNKLLNALEYEKALETLGVCLSPKRTRKVTRETFSKASTISLEQFICAWVGLVDVRAELQKRATITEELDISVSQKAGKKTTKLMRQTLLDMIYREEEEELSATLQVKESVSHIKNERPARQKRLRRLGQLQRRAASFARTKDQLVKDRQAHEEQRLLDSADNEGENCVNHEGEMEELMVSNLQLQARSGDDTLDLRGQQLKEFSFSHDLYPGKDTPSSISGLIILDLSHNQLQSLPSDVFTHLIALQSLDISYNELSTFPKEIGELRNLKLLNARSNRLENVSVALTNLHELRVLHLTYNRITSFGDNCQGLWSLEELNLADNMLEGLTDEVGESLVKLARLDLRGNPTLKRIPKSLQQLQDLKVWDLSACEQKRIGKEMFGPRLQSLRSLNLSYNFLSTLPDSIGTITSLQELKLENNALLSLPSTVANLSELVILNCKRNALQWLPSECGEHWGLLEVLQLSHNRLAALPVTLGMLRVLRVLHLSSNCLTSLPLELGALTSLREFNASWNQLASIPDEFGCLESLTSLDLSHNQISKLPETLSMLNGLTCLQCSHNALTTPLEPSLGNLKRLHYLDLGENRLVEFEPCMYQLPELNVLKLNGNRISMLPREMAQHCIALRQLDLYNNHLQALPLELAHRLLNQLEVFSIGRNPFTLLPEKTSCTWDLKDQYSASCTNEYTPSEVKEWVRDASICYPVFVRVWEQLVAELLESQTLPLLDKSFEDGKKTETKLLPTSREFCQRVESMMRASSDKDKPEGMWQPRYERLARHYFYEVKHVGHTAVFDASTHQTLQKRNEEIKMTLQSLRLERAAIAIEKCNHQRARLKSVYDTDRTVLEIAMIQAREKHNNHETLLLQHARQDTRAFNALLEIQVNVAQQRHEEAQKLQRARFADEMKRLARERLQTKQQLSLKN